MDPAKFKNRPSSRVHFEALQMCPQAKLLAPFNFNHVKKRTQACRSQRPHVQKCLETSDLGLFPGAVGLQNKNPPNGLIFPCHFFVKYPARVSSEPFQKGTVEVQVCDRNLYYGKWHWIWVRLGCPRKQRNAFVT